MNISRLTSLLKNHRPSLYRLGLNLKYIIVVLFANYISEAELTIFAEYMSKAHQIIIVIIIYLLIKIIYNIILQYIDLILFDSLFLNCVKSGPKKPSPEQPYRLLDCLSIVVWGLNCSFS